MLLQSLNLVAWLASEANTRPAGSDAENRHACAERRMASATSTTLDYRALITAVIQSSSAETPASAEGPAMTATQAEAEEGQTRSP